MSGATSDQTRSSGRGWFLAFWFVTEVVGWILVSLVGFGGMAWLLALTALVSVVFVMVYGAIRILRGHDL